MTTQNYSESNDIIVPTNDQFTYRGLDGDDTYILVSKNNTVPIPAVPGIEVFDPTGAGDSFTAGLIYKLISVELDQISQQIAEDIIQFGIACGSHVCMGVGAIDAQPYLEDIDHLLSLNKGGNS